MDIIVGCALILGAAFANGHQAYLLRKNKSCEGVSSLSFFLSLLTSLLLTVNILFLQWDTWLVNYKDFTRQATLSHIIAIAQIATGIIWSGIICGIITGLEETGYLIFSFLVGFVSGLLILVFLFSSALLGYMDFIQMAEILGIISLVYTSIIWIPQIIVTWKTMKTGSLSYLLILGELFGSFTVLIYQSVLEKEHWTTWISEVAVFLEQLILISLFIYILVKIHLLNGKNNRKELNDEESNTIEEIPLDQEEFPTHDDIDDEEIDWINEE